MRKYTPLETAVLNSWQIEVLSKNYNNEFQTLATNNRILIEDIARKAGVNIDRLVYEMRFPQCNYISFSM